MSDGKLILIPEKGLSRLKWEYERERHPYEDLLCLGTADMDYASPGPLLAALREIIDVGHLGYPLVKDDFYVAIHDMLLRTTGWNIDARSSVAQNIGVYMSAWNLIDALTSVGDKITIITPVHFCFRRMIVLNGRVPIECPLHYSNGVYTLDYSMLEASFKSGSHVLWFCNPHNPIGHAWSYDELEKIAVTCLENNVTVISDDVYSGLTFPDVKYTPLASLSKEISYHTATMYSTSKTYNTTGLKHSYVVAENPEILKKYMDSLEKLDLEYGLSLMGMAATIAAYEKCDSWLNELRKEIKSAYEYARKRVEEDLPGAILAQSNSTYFAWLDMRLLPLPVQQLAYLISEEEHVVLENGASLGKGGAGFVRINLACKRETLEECFDRLSHFWKNHLK